MGASLERASKFSACVARKLAFLRHGPGRASRLLRTAGETPDALGLFPPCLCRVAAEGCETQSSETARLGFSRLKLPDTWASGSTRNDQTAQKMPLRAHLSVPPFYLGPRMT